MSVTITFIQKVGYGAWRYDWTGTAPFERHVEGDNAVRGTTTDTSAVLLFQGSNEPAPLEVIDSADTNTPENVQYPPRARIQWRGIPDAIGYRVEQYIASVWTHKQQYMERGAGYYEYESDKLADCATHQFRVIPIYDLNDEGNPLLFSVFMVRNPDAPEIALSYAGGDITAEAAA